MQSGSAALSVPPQVAAAQRSPERIPFHPDASRIALYRPAAARDQRRHRSIL